MSSNSSFMTLVKWLISHNAPCVRKRAALRIIPSSLPSSPKTAKSPSQKLSSSWGISSSVRVQTTAQTMLPAEAPDIIRGNSLASHSAFRTPMWFIPNVAPPDNNKALLPNACRELRTCSRIYFDSMPSHLALADTSSKASKVSKADVMYCSMSCLVPICVCLYIFRLPMSPRSRVNAVRIRNSIRPTSQLMRASSNCFNRACTSGTSYSEEF